MLDEPIGTKETLGQATGGWVAAPIIKKVIQQIAPILGIAPVNEDTKKVRQKLAISDYLQAEARTVAALKTN